MAKPAIVNILPQPYLGYGAATQIIVPDARPLGDGRWIADAVIQWPDGSYDVGAAGLIEGSKKGAEALAEAKACDRWAAIENGHLNKSHPKP
jgi:hypothetical protein